MDIRRANSRLTHPARDLLGDFVRISGTRGFAASFCVFAGAALEGVGLSLLVPVLGLLFNTNGAPRWLQTTAASLFAIFGARNRVSCLLVLLGIFVALMVLRAFVIAARDVLILRLQLDFVESQQIGAATALAAAPWEYLVGFRHARINQILGTDVQRLGVGIHFVVSGGIALVILAVQCVLAFLLAPLFGGMLAASMLLAAIGLAPMLRRSRSIGDHVAEANVSLQNTTAQFMGGLKLAIAHGLQSSFVAEVKETLQHLTARHIRFGWQQALGHAALTTSFGLVGVLAVFGGLVWLHLQPSVLIALLLIVARVSAPLAQFQQAAQQLVHLLPVYENMKELRSELAFAKSRHEDGPDLPCHERTIEFERVSYVRAAGDTSDILNKPAEILRDFDLTIARSEFVGITGVSGGGKTTFADLLAGLYPPRSGQILVSGQRLDKRALAAWRKSLAYVPQDPFLFHDSIRRNLSWANPSASESQMWRALALAGADEFVQRLEHALDAVVGERGTCVSGGERQRIALARALLREPKLLILDEATSALDSAGERDILLALRNLVPRPTIVLIAHRFENLWLCDRVVRFETRGARTIASTIAPAPIERFDARRNGSTGSP